VFTSSRGYRIDTTLPQLSQMLRPPRRQICWTSSLCRSDAYTFKLFIVAARSDPGQIQFKGEAPHNLSRFLCFGKEGVLRGREFGVQVHTFSCLSVLHKAVVAWNILHIESIVNQLRAEGKNRDDHILSLTTPLMRKHLNPFGRYYFDLNRMRRLPDEIP